MIKLKSLIHFMLPFFLLSCNKGNEKKGTFIIKGQVIEDCDNNKLTNEELQAYYFKKGDWIEASKFENMIGKAITDSKGNFELVCNNYGGGEYKIVGKRTGILVSQNISPENNSALDLKSIYYDAPFYIVLKILVSGTFSSSDTLFIGGRVIYPLSSGVFYQEYNSPHGHSGTQTDASLTGKYEWSIGKNGTKTKFTSKFEPCVADTTIVNVSK